MPHLIKSKCMQTLFNLFHKKHNSCMICWNQNDQQLLHGICNYTQRLHSIIKCTITAKHMTACI